MRQIRVAVAAAAAACILTACSSSQPSNFAVTSASVDPSYWCPGGANNAKYDLHATVNVRNETGHDVSIESVTAVMTLAAVQGSWLEKVGDRYDAGSATFSPSTVGAGSSAALKAVIPSACTSDKYGAATSSYGDYSVKIRIVTSAGPFSITAQNQHQIRAA
jgi:hypothetical protein